MNEQTIFTAALERQLGERSAFLDEVCGTNEELRHASRSCSDCTWMQVAFWSRQRRIVHPPSNALRSKSQAPRSALTNCASWLAKAVWAACLLPSRKRPSAARWR